MRFHCKLSENFQLVRFHCKDDEEPKIESNNYADYCFPDITEKQKSESYADSYFTDETEEPKEDAEGGQALLKKEDPVAGTVGEIFVFYKSHRWAKEKKKGLPIFTKVN